MVVSQALLIVFVILNSSDALDLPSYFTKCKKSDPQLSACIKKNIIESWPIFVKGDSKYHILPMDPLHIPFLHVKADTNLYGNMTDGQVDGMRGLQLKDVKIDLDKKRVDLYYLIPVISIHGNYDISGKIFNLPISGQGDTNVTFVNGVYHYFFEYNLKEKTGNQYIEIIASDLKHTDLEKVYFNMNILNNRLGDEINKALNENWRELNKEVTDSVGFAFAEVFKTILQEFFKKFPFDNFFAEE